MESVYDVKTSFEGVMEYSCNTNVSKSTNNFASEIEKPGFAFFVFL